MEKCAFLTQTLAKVNDPNLDENEGIQVQCHVCRTKKIGGLTLVKFYAKNGKIWWENNVLSCTHRNYDGEAGCSCCHTIRDGKPVCGSCAGWNILSGRITNNMKKHNFTWTDGSVTAWKKKPSFPLFHFECDCGKINCFPLVSDAKRAGWTGQEIPIQGKYFMKCPTCKPKRTREELEEENTILKAKLAKITRLLD